MFDKSMTFDAYLKKEVKNLIMVNKYEQFEIIS